MFSTVQTSDRTVVVQPGHEVDRNDMRPLRLLLEDAIRCGARRVVVDFGRTEHLYYRVADLLDLVDQRLREQGGELILAGMSRYLEDIFSVVGYVNRFACIPCAPGVSGDIHRVT